MQIDVQDLLDINFSSSMCYDTVSTYDTSILSLLLNSTAISAFCMHGMHDTTYDTPIVGSLTLPSLPPLLNFLQHSVAAGINYCRILSTNP